jgi:hypothetical protein
MINNIHDYQNQITKGFLGHRGVDVIAPPGSGNVSEPKIGTGHNRIPQRVAIPAGVPFRIACFMGKSLRVGIRNVGNNSCIFASTSAISLQNYNDVVFGGGGAEPAQGEGLVLEYDGEVWAYSTSGTILLVTIYQQ